MQHLEEGTVHAWLDGELPPDEAESAARHVAGCAECRALVVEARGLRAGASRIVSALDAGPAGVIPRAQRGGGLATSRRPWYRFALTPVRMSIAATIIAAAGLTFTARRVADNSALREKAADKQFVTVAVPAAPTSRAAADSIDAPKERRASGKPKAPLPASLAAANADMDSSRPAAAPKAQLTDAAGFEQKTLHLDRRAIATSPQIAPASATPPAAEPAPSAARVDLARAKDERVAVDSLRQGPIPDRRQAAAVAGNANQMQGLVLTERDADRASSALILRDCYRVAVDSTEWRGIVPSGFALAAQSSSLNKTVQAATFAAGGAGASGGGAGRGGAGATPGAAQPVATNLPAASPAPAFNAVRALDSSGRVGPTVIGLWSLGHADTIGVRLSNADAKKAVTLLLTSGGSKARVISGGRTDSVRVDRTVCVR